MDGDVLLVATATQDDSLPASAREGEGNGQDCLHLPDISNQLSLTSSATSVPCADAAKSAGKSSIQVTGYTDHYRYYKFSY